MASDQDDGRHAIDQDSYDRLFYKEARESIPELRQIEAAAEAKGYDGEALCQDVFASLYKAEPAVSDDTVAAHRKLVEEMLGTTEHEALRAQTTLDEGASALATAELARRVVENARERPKPKPGDDPLALDPMTLKGGKKGDDDAMRCAIRKLVKASAQATEDALEDVAAICGWGGGRGPGDRTDMALVQEATRHVKRSEKLRAILDLAGRMVPLAIRTHQTRLEHGPDEVVDVEVGSAVERALPSELVLLRHRLLRREVLRKIAEGQLLQYKMVTRTPEGRGPIVCAIDCSSSMRGAREAWAKALGLGLLSIARMEKRQFAIVLFSSGVKFWQFDGQPSLEMIVAALEYFEAGGTDFELALDTCLDICEGPLRKADIVFITDGICEVSDEWRAEWMPKKEKLGTRLWGITVGTTARSLDSIANGVAAVWDLRRDAEAVELAFGF